MCNTKFLLFGHDGSGNRGCEAIIRTTSKMLGEGFKNAEIAVATNTKEDDIELHIPEVKKYVSHETIIKRYTLPWAKYLIYNRVKKDYEKSYLISQRNLIKEVKSSDICLSVGGDTYCYGDPVHLYAIDKSVKKIGKKLLLWGASLEPNCVTQRMKEDLKLFDAIFTRESITYNYLKLININANIFLYPDPAFNMEQEDLPLPDRWVNGNMIGINLSPLIMKYESTAGIILKAFKRLIQEILENTNFNIVLIPHVTNENDSDYNILKLLYDENKISQRVIILNPNYTAPQIKGYIARCRLFIGARTHSTVAAYSTLIPCLAIGYSTKSLGIARDIFGSEQNYVIAIQHLSNDNELIEKFNFLLKNEQNIRKKLEETIPIYKLRACNAATQIQALFNYER